MEAAFFYRSVQERGTVYILVDDERSPEVSTTCWLSATRAVACLLLLVVVVVVRRRKWRHIPLHKYGKNKTKNGSQPSKSGPPPATTTNCCTMRPPFALYIYACLGFIWSGYAAVALAKTSSVDRQAAVSRRRQRRL